MALSKSNQILATVGNEMKERPPKILASTEAKFGPKRAEKQRVAILLNKSRKMGARLPLTKKSV